MFVRLVLPASPVFSCLLSLAVAPSTLAVDCNGNGVDDATDIMPIRVFAPTSYDTPGEPSAIAATAVMTDGQIVPLDVNGDGHADIVIDQHMPPAVNVHLGDGSGGFDAGTTYEVGTNASICAVPGDLDGDGDHDLLVVNPDDYSIFVLTNDGQGSFQQTSTFETSNPWSPYAAILADLDGDDDLDVILRTRDFDWMDRLWVLQNDGFGSLTEIQSEEMGNAGSVIQVGDIDGDNDLDIAMDIGYEVTILINNGSGSFPFKGHVPLGNGGRFRAMADVDQDDDLDLIGAMDQSILVLHNDGSGIFAAPETHESDIFVAWTEMDDLNNDGWIDLVAIGQAVDFSGIKVAYMLNNGLGGFTGEGIIASVNTAIMGPAITLVDVDQDGDPDPIVCEYSTWSFLLLRNNALPATSADCNMNGVPDECDLISRIEYDPTLVLSISDDPFEIEATSFDSDGNEHLLDLNDDGAQDLIVGAENGDLGVFLNRGGTGDAWLGYHDPVYYPAGGSGGGPTGLAAGDLDGDGDIDIAASSVVGGDLDVLFNDGSGTFSPAQQVIDGNNLPDIAMADLNGDGSLDLAATAPNDNKVWVVLNEGDGTFSSAVGFDVGDAPRGIAAADVDGDGHVDLASADSAENGSNQIPTVTILLGDGSGGFPGKTTVTDFDSSDSPFHLVLADMDGDDRPDLVVITQDTAVNADMLIFKNDGSGQFVDRSVYSFGAPHHVRAADLEGDGDLDLAIADRAGGGVAMTMLNDGLGQFSLEQTDQVGLGPSALAAGDCDSDGDVDLYSADQFSSSVTVLRMEAFIPAYSNDVDGDGIPDECTCPGDATGDGQADVNDVLALLAAYGTNDPNSDLDGDGIVNVNDILLLLQWYGDC